MRKPVAVLVVLALLIVGVGFYRGWFTPTSPATSAGSRETNVNLKVDRDKIQDDVDSVQQKSGELIGNDLRTPAAEENATTGDR